MESYSVEYLGNGYYLIRGRASGLRGLYHPDGRYHCGDLRLSQGAAATIIGR